MTLGITEFPAMAVGVQEECYTKVTVTVPLLFVGKKDDFCMLELLRPGFI